MDVNQSIYRKKKKKSGKTNICANFLSFLCGEFISEVIYFMKYSALAILIFFIEEVRLARFKSSFTIERYRVGNKRTWRVIYGKTRNKYYTYPFLYHSTFRNNVSNLKKKIALYIAKTIFIPLLHLYPYTRDWIIINNSHNPSNRRASYFSRNWKRRRRKKKSNKPLHKLRKKKKKTRIYPLERDYLIFHGGEKKNKQKRKLR